VDHSPLPLLRDLSHAVDNEMREYIDVYTTYSLKLKINPPPMLVTQSPVLRLGRTIHFALITLSLTK
jgi:hypothetical protein